jgi:hypothetical protein
MRKIMSACICLVFSIAAEARPKFEKKLMAGNPDTCPSLSGIWVGECNEDGSIMQAKLQIFQQGCTELALFDFDYPIPKIYTIGRENRTINPRNPDYFMNLTTYASWAKDGKFFQAMTYGNAEDSSLGKKIITTKKEDFSISMGASGLATVDHVETYRSDSQQTISYSITCTYNRTR